MTARPIPKELRNNFRALYYDIFWFGVLAGSAMAFVTIYATRLGASAFNISMLTAGPAVVNLLISLPVARFLAGRPLIPITFWSALLQRIGFLLLLPLPLLFSEPEQINVIILVTIAMAVPGTILAVAFNSMFAELVPAEYRAEVVGKRNALVAISLTVSTLISGLLLDTIVFPLNYQIVFAIGAAGAAMSTYYIWRLRAVEPAPVPVSQPAEQPLQGNSEIRPGQRRDFRQWLHLDLLRTSFGPFMAAYLIFYTFQYLGIPLFPLVQVNVLNLSDGAISLGGGLFYLAMLLVSLRMINISSRWGHKRVLVTGASMFCSYPLLLGLARGPALFWAASAAGGGAWGVVNAGLTNRLMEKVPAAQRPAGMALHNVALNLGILFGSLGASWMGESFGLQNALLVVAALRLLAGLLFRIWG